MTSHSKLSPSKAHRWMACPGSIREEAKYPDTRNPAAIDGTHSHTLLEHCLTNDVAAESLIGTKLTDHDGEFTVTVDRVQRVNVALEYIKQRLSEMDGAAVVIAEKRVSPANYVGRTDLDGTCDIQIIAREAQTVEIIDYKDGMTPVDVVDNHQLELYAIGVLAELLNSTDYKNVVMTVVQPKMILKGKQPISSHKISSADLLAKVPKYIVGAKATDAADAPLVAGDHCGFCKHSGACIARNAKVMDAVGIVPIAADIAEQAAGTDVATMSDEKMVQIIEAAPALRQMIESVEAEALRRLEAGVPVKGLKLVNGRGSSAWALTEEQVVDKLVKMGVPKSAVYESKLVSPAKAKKLSWVKTEAGVEVTKTLSERQLKTLEQEYVTKLAGKPTVALESDPRPPLVRDVSNLFGAVSEVKAVPQLPSWLI